MTTFDKVDSLPHDRPSSRPFPQQRITAMKKLTTAAGAPVADNQNIMTAGPRGPARPGRQRPSALPEADRGLPGGGRRRSIAGNLGAAGRSKLYLALLGAEPDSTGVAKQRRACRAPVSSLNHWNATKRQRRAFRSRRVSGEPLHRSVLGSGGEGATLLRILA